MPLVRLKSSVIALLMVLASLWAASASAATSMWPPRATSQSAMIGDYRALSCPRSPPPAYTGHLRVDSKYDQSEASKTTLVPLPQESERIRQQITEYHRGLQEIITRYERARNEQEVNLSLACLHQWLEAWAQPGAMLSREVSGTGRAVRKWSLAALGSGLLKVRALSNGGYQLSTAQRSWLERLSNAVISDYSPRQTLDFTWFNNHDYWAAWAVSSTGMLLDRNAHIDWAAKTLQLAFEQMQPGQAGDYVQLPLETARGRLAVDYTHYALVPLVLLAESMQANGRSLSTDQQRKLGQLANFAVRGVLEPANLPELEAGQERPPNHKMVWLIPFLKQQPGHILARQLYGQAGSELGYYGQVGGNIRFFYPNID